MSSPEGVRRSVPEKEPQVQSQNGQRASMHCRAEVWASRLEPAGQAGCGEEGLRSSSLDGHLQQNHWWGGAAMLTRATASLAHGPVPSCASCSPFIQLSSLRIMPPCSPHWLAPWKRRYTDCKRVCDSDVPSFCVVCPFGFLPYVQFTHPACAYFLKDCS